MTYQEFEGTTGAKVGAEAQANASAKKVLAASGSLKKCLPEIILLFLKVQSTQM